MANFVRLVHFLSFIYFLTGVAMISWEYLPDRYTPSMIGALGKKPMSEVLH